MFGFLSSYFNDDLAIDLGTANTLIYVRGKGIVLDEPSVVAIRQEGGPNGKKVIQEVGIAAKQMLGRTPGNITAIRPMKDGVIADFTVTEQMLKQFIKKVHDSRLFKPSPRIIICVPCGSTQVERRAIRESAHRRGRVQRLPDRGADGRGDRRRPAGRRSDRLDGRRHRRRHHRSGRDLAGRPGLQGLGARGRRQVRRSDHQLHPPQLRHADRRDHRRSRSRRRSARRSPGSEVREKEVKGRNLAEGIPRSFTISSNEILEALTDPLNSIVSAVKSALEQTPPELGADIAEKGMVLTGGGALLRDIDRLLMEETGLPVMVAEDPLTCVVRGSGMALEKMERWRAIFTND